MYECESWTIKKAEHQRIDAFELWCWRRLLRIPWTARRSNQSILKEISPEYSLEGLMLKLKLPILWSPNVKNWLIWKDPDAGKDWRWEKKGRTQDEMVGWHHRLDGHEFEQALGVGDGQGGLACRSPRGRKESTQLSDWTELKLVYKLMWNKGEIFWHKYVQKRSLTERITSHLWKIWKLKKFFFFFEKNCKFFSSPQGNKSYL